MTIRNASPNDAEHLITHVQRMANEPNCMIPLAPGEFQFTVEQEEDLLSIYAGADNSAFFVAEVEGIIVGVLNCDGGKRQATRHSASFGMSVAPEWRNKGIGTGLISHLFEWATATGIIHRLELEVYAHNAPAIHLYRKFSFVEEGQRQRAYFQHGQWINSVLMARLL